MRRVTLTIVATITGLILLLQFKVHPISPGSGGLAVLNAPTAPTGTSVQRHHRRSHHRRSQQPRSTSSPTPTSTPHRHHSAAPAVRTITGQTIQTQYGPVQVQIVESGTQLTNVTTLQVPNDNSHSAEIAANAVPILRREALQANSARIDVVSGATYTSNGYAQSLQSALDNA